MAMQVISTTAEEAFRRIASDSALPQGIHCLRVVKQELKENVKDGSPWKGHAMLKITCKSVNPDDTDAELSDLTVSRYLLTTAVVGERDDARADAEKVRGSGIKDFRAFLTASKLVDEATPEAVDTFARGLCDDSLSAVGAVFYAKVENKEGSDFSEVRILNRLDADTALAFDVEVAPF
jgi:hypothetical protein